MHEIKCNGGLGDLVVRQICWSAIVLDVYLGLPEYGMRRYNESEQSSSFMHLYTDISLYLSIYL